MTDIAFPVTELPNSAKSDTGIYLISICIPTYNRIDDLKICLNPLLEKYGNSNDVEIIVIDNGSTDKTSEYLIDKNNIFSNTSFYIRERNAGFDINVLDCYYKAKGEYVHFLGDDDSLVVEAFDELMQMIREEAHDLILSNYTVKTNKRAFNVLNKQTKTFEDIDSLFAYVGHYLTFMSSITLKKQPVALQSISRYINFKFMHISLILEILSGRNTKLLYSDKPISIATDNNPATYDVADIFLACLTRSFQINIHKLNLKKIEPFFVSVMCHSIGSNIKISKLLLNNAIFGLVGLNTLLNISILKSILRRILVKLGRLKR